MRRWEYSRVVWVYSTSRKGKRSTWKQVYTIHWPGGATEERLGWTSEDTDEKTTTIVELQNELGSQGWELTSANVLDSIIMSERYGWPNVGTPVRMDWVFKRRISD